MDESRYGEAESKRRFEAALRGARSAEPKPMKAISGNRGAATHKAQIKKNPQAKPI